MYAYTALSCWQASFEDKGGQIEVGVHIADVGHFLKLGTVTDARQMSYKMIVQE